MNLLTRPVDYDREHTHLLDILGRNLPDLPHAKRFSWLYEDNPAGIARSWFVCDGSPDRIVGAATVVPRLLSFGSRIIRCGQVVDFAVEASHRSLGPAIELQKATLSPVDDGELFLCYDCPPHERGLAPFRRLRVAPSFRMVRLSKLLRTDDMLRRRLRRLRAFHRPTAALANLFLTTRDALPRRRHGIQCRIHDCDFDDEFTTLDQQLLNDEGGIRSVRNAELLNWLYRHNPLRRFAVLSARREGQLCGFATSLDTGRKVEVIELVGSSEEVVLALLHTLSEMSRSSGKTSIELILVDGSPRVATAEKAGFWKREIVAHVVMYMGQGAQNSVEPARCSFGGAEILA